MIGMFAKYMVVGAIGTGVNLAVYALLLYFNINYLMAACVSFVVAVTNNFYWNFIWTFKNCAANKSIKQKYIKFFIVSVINFGLNILLLKLFVDVFLFHKIIAQIISIGLVSISNFIMNHKFTFR